MNTPSDGIQAIDTIESIGIKAEAKRRSLSEITLLGTYEHPKHMGSSDWMIKLYDLNGYRVADTNGDPVWEQQDETLFAELLEEYGIDNPSLAVLRRLSLIAAQRGAYAP